MRDYFVASITDDSCHLFPLKLLLYNIVSFIISICISIDCMYCQVSVSYRIGILPYRWNQRGLYFERTFVPTLSWLVGHESKMVGHD